MPTENVTLRLHRGRVFEDLNDAFAKGTVTLATESVEVHLIMPNGQREGGEDTEAVLLSVFSEYWHSFYGRCCSGNDFLLPDLMHCMSFKWGEVAKVLVYGYVTAHYLPLRVAPAFLNACLGRPSTREEVISSFLRVIPKDDFILLESLNTFEGNEDLEQFKMDYEIRKAINQGNWREVLHEVAHKKVLQEKAYIIKCWNEVFKNQEDRLQGISL